MIKQQALIFGLRWIASSCGMFLCLSWLGTVNSAAIYSTPWMLYVVAGLIFSLANSFIKPLAKMMVLPLAILTMGVSTLAINALMVIITIRLLPGVEMSLIGAAISSIILSGINALLSIFVN